MAKQSISAAIGTAVGKPSAQFNLDSYKQSRNLDKTTRMKQQEYIKISPAVCEVLSLPGIPQGHITLIRGLSNTGKSSLLIDIMKNCQKQGILPVLIMTEMKWSWKRAIKMGVEAEEFIDDDGVVDYKGFFIYRDNASLGTIEDVAEFINELLVDQKKGHLKVPLCFLWDSIGTIPCQRSVESNKNNNEWNAGAMSTQFGSHLNQQFGLSRKEGYPYTNTFVAINHIWIEKPAFPGAQPKIKNKGGETMFRDATLILTYGSAQGAGIQKIKATRKGRDIQFAFRTKLSVDKNHITGQTTDGTLINTDHGFIFDTKESLDAYKKEHSHEWLTELGGSDFEVVDEDSRESVAPDYDE